MDEHEYERQLTQLEIFVGWYEKQAYRGPKRSIADDNAKMIAGFKYVIEEVRKIHDTIPFNYDWGPSLEDDICQVMSNIFVHAHNKPKAKGNWLNDVAIRCGDILIAIISGHGHLYGIYWDEFEMEK